MRVVEKAFTSPEQKKSVTDDDVTIKLQHFILITLPHINVVTAEGGGSYNSHNIGSQCHGAGAGTQREYSLKLLIALLNVF